MNENDNREWGRIMKADREEDLAMDTLLECCVCGHIYRESQRVAARCEDEPGCPSCGSDNCIDIEEQDMLKKHETGLDSRARAW